MNGVSGPVHAAPCAAWRTDRCLNDPVSARTIARAVARVNPTGSSPVRRVRGCSLRVGNCRTGVPVGEARGVRAVPPAGTSVGLSVQVPIVVRTP
jgi:hypothetical protein